MADLREDINGGFAFSRYLNGTFPSRKCSVKVLVNHLRREDFLSVILLIWVNVSILNGAISSRRCSIKEPAK